MDVDSVLLNIRGLQGSKQLLYSFRIFPLIPVQQFSDSLQLSQKVDGSKLSTEKDG